MKTENGTKLFLGTAAFSIVYSFFTSCFLYNNDILHQKDSSVILTPSQLDLWIAGMFMVMGVVYWLFDNSSKFKIELRAQFIQYALIMPFILVLFSTTLLETYVPDSHNTLLVDSFVTFTLISLFAFITGTIMFVVNIVRAFINEE